MDFWHFSSADWGKSGSFVGGWAGTDWTFWEVKQGFRLHCGRGVISWCCLQSVCYICSNHIWWMDAIVTWTTQQRAIFRFGCPALRCSPWVGLLLRWSHSCLIVECPYFVPHPSVCPHHPPTHSSLFFPLLSKTLLPPQGVRALYFWKKKKKRKKKVTLFVNFLAGLSLCSAVVQKCMVGKWEGNQFLPHIYSLLFCGPIPAGV